MRSLILATAALSLLSSATCDSNLTTPLSSRVILPSAFRPPPVFRNVNLLRTVNLEKLYPRETINVVVENVDASPQDEYFVPFEAGVVDKVGGLEVRDKKGPEKPAFPVELVEYDPNSSTQFYRVRLPTPLEPKDQQTLSITYSVLSSLRPLPATIQQQDKQYVVYELSAYAPSAYTTLKQKTKLKFPTVDIPDYTVLPSGNSEGKEDPQRQGTSFTYGPYGEVPAGAQEAVSVRYEFTKPLTHATLLERDIEVSHWGGNLAVEERYWLTNRGAQLANHFSRVAWATTQYYSPPTSALKTLKVPLKPGSLNPYFTDDIGNVSTSRFRSSAREANLDLTPRYPVFGGWKYNFRIGWDADLSKSLRRLGTSRTTYVLRVPFLEGPKQPEGIEYEKVRLRVILPEGATDVKYTTDAPLTSAAETKHRTFMDSTAGRSTLELVAVNVVDEMRDREIIVTYTYPLLSILRKPLTISAGVLSLFATAWLLGRVDTSIRGGK